MEKNNPLAVILLQVCCCYLGDQIKKIDEQDFLNLSYHRIYQEIEKILFM